MRISVRIAYDWAVRSFGKEHVHNAKVRSLRLAEEAIELCQALELDRKQIIRLVCMVYSRPKGTVSQELGGVTLTTAILCASLGSDPDEFFENELRRVLQKPPEHFEKRNQEKISLGMN